MTRVHFLPIGFILRPASRGNAWLWEVMGQTPPMAVAGRPHLWVWRRGALLAGYLLMLIVGLERLGAQDATGVVMIAAAVLGALLVHRRWLTVGIWLGVLMAGGFDVAGGGQLGLLAVLGGLGGAVLGGLDDRVPVNQEPALAAAVPLSAEPAPAPEAPLATQPMRLAPVPLGAPSADEAEPASASSSQAEKQLAPGLHLMTVGRLRLVEGSRDLTSVALRPPALSFIWLYLLAYAVVAPGDLLSRAALGDLVAEGISDSDQLRRVRDHVRDFRKRLPAALVACIYVDETALRFAGDGCHWDVAELRRLEAVCREQGELVPDGLLAELEAAVDPLPPGPFLPGWEAVDQKLTQGRSGAGEVIEVARRQVENLRADLAAVLAANYKARGQPQKAVQALAERVNQTPEREDLKRSLVGALTASGQLRRAHELQKDLDGGGTR